MAYELFDIKGQHALVTGSGSGGIGTGMAEGLLEAGCTVVLHSHGNGALAQAEKFRAMGYDAYAVTGDISTEEGVNQVFNKAMEYLDGRIDILVNAAGTQFRCAAREFPLDEFNRVLSVNLTATFIFSKLAAANMIPRNYGKIINVASMQTFFGVPNIPAYAASKGGVGQLTKSMGNDLITSGINVNAVAPGWIKTNLTSNLFNQPERVEEVLQRVPAGRFGEPADFKGITLFLASHASDYLVGTVIPVDGGYLVR